MTINSGILHTIVIGYILANTFLVIPSVILQFDEIPTFNHTISCDSKNC